MHIYLDSKDLINLLDDSQPCTLDQLDKTLRAGNHKLVVSSSTIMELSAPLAHITARAGVMARLNRLESLPHRFINSSRIPMIELTEAVKAFAKLNECEPASVFVSRFDEAILLSGSPPTRVFQNYPLAAIVWDLHTLGALPQSAHISAHMRELFGADRRLLKKPDLKDHFPAVVSRNLKLYNIAMTPSRVTDLANWIYADPRRCPSQRLIFEVWHRLLRNVGDVPKDSDLEDFFHFSCLPYVDLMSLDRRMYNYVAQAAAPLTLLYEDRLARNLGEILERL